MRPASSPPAFPVFARLAPVVLAAVVLPIAARELPTVVVSGDDTVITRSCEIVIPAGTVIADANTNGVIQVRADGVTLRFAPGSELRGAPASTPWDQLRGIGIRIDGQRRVRILGARVHGFFNGLVATRSDGLVLEGGDFSDNYRQRLLSTPQAENGADWLFPHDNDERKWRDQYGGAVCVENARGIVLRDILVRRGQNGIILDRVDRSRIYDNDCSFLSGWGLALWRSSRNVIARNAFDFCVRGHVEGVYNRGQDSAGILCFEQCNENVIAENSVTHGGDGFFGFAGRDALGEPWMNAERERLRRETGRQDVDALLQVPPEIARDFSARGCNRNLLVGNDFSYAPAHGIEMTFSEGNVFARNRLVGNAICGIWGGYSSDTLIAENTISENGGMAYGLERGGINMEHASGNRIVRNIFRNNKCAIHLWWDNDAALLRSPGVAGLYRGVSGNVIADNAFVIGPDHPFTRLRASDRLIVLQLRDDGSGNVRDNRYFGPPAQLTVSNATEIAATPAAAAPLREGRTPRYRLAVPRLPGVRKPVGARPHLAGRDRILLDEWGPWDHESPLVRTLPGPQAGGLVLEVLGVEQAPRIEGLPGTVTTRLESLDRPQAWRLHLTPPPGITPFQARLVAHGLERRVAGTLVATAWDATFFTWTPATDPRTNLLAWRALALEPNAVRVSLPHLDLPYAGGGPRDLRLAPELTQRGPGSDRFGLIARTRLAMPKGNWRLRTLSDDGVRVRVDGKALIENWTWHGPTPDEAIFRQESDGTVEIEVEHFEIDGYATLRFEIEPATP